LHFHPWFDFIVAQTRITETINIMFIVVFLNKVDVLSKPKSELPEPELSELRVPEPELSELWVPELELAKLQLPEPELAKRQVPEPERPERKRTFS